MFLWGLASGILVLLGSVVRKSCSSEVLRQVVLFFWDLASGSRVPLGSGVR